MTQTLILASGSEIRRTLLQKAGLEFDVLPVRIDENAAKDALIAEGAKPRDIADYLAEAKARRVAQSRPETMVIGCDQILEFDGRILSKPSSKQDAMEQLSKMRGTTHRLMSAAVLYENREPIWRHVGVVKLHMRDISDSYLDDYVTRNWESIQHAVGGYKLEEEGVRLFHRVEGDYFNVLGLPLLELLSYLTLKGVIPG